MEPENPAHGANDNRFQPPVGFQQRFHLGIKGFHVQGHQDAKPGIRNLLLDFSFRVKRIDVDDDAAGLEHRVITDHRIRAVRQHQTDLDPLVDAKRLEPLGRAVYLIGDFPVFEAPATEADAGLIAISRRFVEQIRQGTGRDVRPPVDIRRIGLLPREGPAGFLRRLRTSPPKGAGQRSKSAPNFAAYPHTLTPVHSISDRSTDI